MQVFEYGWYVKEVHGVFHKVILKLENYKQHLCTNSKFTENFCVGKIWHRVTNTIIKFECLEIHRKCTYFIAKCAVFDQNRNTEVCFRHQ